MTIDEKLTAIRDVIQFDIGERGLARDPERNLINACPDDFANACRSIGEHPAPSVAIITGFYIITADPPCGETDGPLGALYFARAFRSLRIASSIVTDPFCNKSLRIGCDHSSMTDLEVWSIPQQAEDREHFFSLDWPAIAEWQKLTHLIAIERVGPAQDDRCYTMRGRDISDFMSPAHLLIENAARRKPGFTTIGIGDGGNEIGMGKIPRDVIAKNIDNGEKIACRVATDHLIVAGISNWGAYALAAGVAILRGQKLDDSLFDAERERKLLQLMVEHGPLVDGKTGQRTATVDGVAFEEYFKPLARIRQIMLSTE